MRVTAIEPRRKGLSALCLDEEQILVDTETLLSFGIRPGDELDQQRLDELVSASDRRRARERALYILTYRDHSREELRRKLLVAGFAQDAAETAVQKMCEIGLIDDEEYARKLARELLQRKRLSERRAAAEMTRRGLEREQIEQAIAEIAPDPAEQLAAIIAKKYTPLPGDEKGRRRMCSALARMGFGWSDIRSAITQAEESLESWEEPDE